MTLTPMQKQTIRRLIARIEKAGFTVEQIALYKQLKGHASDLRAAKRDRDEGVPKNYPLRSWIADEYDAVLDDGSRDYVAEDFKNLMSALDEWNRVEGL